MKREKIVARSTHAMGSSDRSWACVVGPGEESNAKMFSASMVPPAECAGIIECAITATSYAERANIRTTVTMDRVEDEED